MVGIVVVMMMVMPARDQPTDEAGCVECHLEQGRTCAGVFEVVVGEKIDEGLLVIESLGILLTTCRKLIQWDPCYVEHS